MELTVKEISEKLKTFRGGVRYQHHMGGFLVTEGVDYMSTNCKAHWILIDTYLLTNDILRNKEFIRIELNKVGSSAVITYCDMNDLLIHEKHYPFTTFPLDRVVLYYKNNTFLLPKEY